jgi:hypothetical protein
LKGRSLHRNAGNWAGSYETLLVNHFAGEEKEKGGEVAYENATLAE